MNKLVIFIILIAGIIGGIYYWKTTQIANKTQSQNTPIIPAKKMSQTSMPTSSTPQPFPTNTWVTNAIQATIKTAKGDIVIKLYPQDAPKTVINFATLAKSGYYSNLIFHRVVSNFVIQGGDPNGNGTGGYSIYGPTFEDELNASTPSYIAGYMQGVLAMANRGPNTNGSQFFIMLADNPNLPKNYTIFGKVTSGMDVVKQIAIGDKMLQILIQ